MGCLDDDIVLLPSALEKMIECWNRCSADTAGISFNIINMPADRHNWLKGVMGLSGPVQGRVLRSGRSTPIAPVTVDIAAEWLCGGATVWRLDVLTKYSNREAHARWAPLEDLIFSYPIGKRHPLYVCAAAEVRHEHVYDHNVRMKYAYYGRTETLWRLFFVESNHELSRVRFLWLQVTTILARLFMAITSLQMRHLQFAVGQITGVLIGMKALIQGRDLFALLNEPLHGGVLKADRRAE